MKVVLTILVCFWGISALRGSLMASEAQAGSLEDLDLDGREAPQYRDSYPYPAVPVKVSIPSEKCNRNYCPRTAEMELALEREFWVYIQNNDLVELQTWINKTYDYITGSKTYKGARFHKLIGFAKLMISRSVPLVSGQSITNILGGMKEGRISERADPGEFGVRAFNLVSKAMLGFALKPWYAQRAINELLAMEHQYADWGIEGKAVAAHTLIQVKDHGSVRRGIDLFLEDDEAAVKITSSLAPFKPAGEYYTIGEGYIYLGEWDLAEIYFNKAIAFATEHNMPAEQIARLMAMITDVKENYSKAWAKGQSINWVRLPLAPSMGPLGCALCHTGAKVPDNYYQ